MRVIGLSRGVDIITHNPKLGARITDSGSNVKYSESQSAIMPSKRPILFTYLKWSKVDFLLIYPTLLSLSASLFRAAKAFRGSLDQSENGRPKQKPQKWDSLMAVLACLVPRPRRVLRCQSMINQLLQEIWHRM